MLPFSCLQSCEAVHDLVLELAGSRRYDVAVRLAKGAAQLHPPVVDLCYGHMLAALGRCVGAKGRCCMLEHGAWRFGLGAQNHRWHKAMHAV